MRLSEQVANISPRPGTTFKHMMPAVHPLLPAASKLITSSAQPPSQPLPRDLVLGVTNRGEAAAGIAARRLQGGPGVMPPAGEGAWGAGLITAAGSHVFLISQNLTTVSEVPATGPKSKSQRV